MLGELTHGLALTIVGGQRSPSTLLNHANTLGNVSPDQAVAIAVSLAALLVAELGKNPIPPPQPTSTASAAPSTPHATLRNEAPP